MQEKLKKISKFVPAFLENRETKDRITLDKAFYGILLTAEKDNGIVEARSIFNGVEISDFPSEISVLLKACVDISKIAPCFEIEEFLSLRDLDPLGNKYKLIFKDPYGEEEEDIDTLSFFCTIEEKVDDEYKILYGFLNRDKASLETYEKMKENLAKALTDHVRWYMRDVMDIDLEEELKNVKSN